MENSGKTAHIIVASNNVLLELLFSILDRSGVKVSQLCLDNGTTIRIMGNEVTMIYPNSVSDANRFVTKEEFDSIFLGSDNSHLTISKHSIIYLVRHGHARHNDPKASLYDSWDPELTLLGWSQAKASGTAILNDSQILGAKEFKAYCSPLVRTHQTVYEILQQFPPQVRPEKCIVLIEALEHTRPIGGLHHWRKDDPLFCVAKDPYLSTSELSLLFPDGTAHETIERARVENLPRAGLVEPGQDSIINLDWKDFDAKISKIITEGKTFGQVATETLFLDSVLQHIRYFSSDDCASK